MSDHIIKCKIILKCIFCTYLLFMSLEVSSVFLSKEYSILYAQSKEDKSSSTQEKKHKNALVGRELIDSFSKIRLLISEKNFSEVYPAIELLRAQSTNKGYTNIPDFSYHLIRSAKNVDISLENKVKLLLYAEVLSPTHPGVLLSLSSAPSILGYRSSLSYLWRGSTELVGYPLSVASLFARGLVASIGALFLTLLTVTFVLLIRNSGEMYIAIATKLPRSIRGLIAFIVFPLVLFAPLLLPLMLTLVCWVVGMSILLRRMKLLCIVSSLLVLLILYGLPIASRIIETAESPVSKALENVNQGGFSPRNQEYLDTILSEGKSNITVEILLGRSLHERGKLEEAKDIYQEVIQASPPTKGLLYVVKMNRGAVYFSKGEVSRAFDMWESLYKEGWHEFELFYNLSLSSVLIFKQDKYEYYYSLAQKQYPDKLKQLPLEPELSPEPLLAKMPHAFFSDILKTSFQGKDIMMEMSVESMPLMQRVIGDYSIRFYWLLSMVLFGLGVWQFMSSNKSYRYRGSLVTKRIFILFKNSTIWNYLPFGSLVLLQKEVSLLVGVFIVYLGILIGLVSPVRLFPEQIDAIYVWGLCASLVIIISAVYPVKQLKRE